MYRPIEIIDTWDDWGESVHENPPYKMSRGKKTDARWSNFDGLEVKIALIRAPNYDPAKKVKIGKSSDIYDLMRDTLADEVVESSFVIALTASHRVIGIHQLSRGTVHEVHLTSGDVLRVVLAAGARSFVIVHNHPSGDIEPSRHDIEITKKIFAAAELLDVRMLDHVVISANGYTSFADRGLI